jgi:FtsZ-binding cell division protein ZapB
MSHFELAEQAATYAIEIMRLQKECRDKDAEIAALLQKYSIAQHAADCLEAERDALRERVRVLREALNAMLTHMGMDEDDWNKPTYDQARDALAATKGET